MKKFLLRVCLGDAVYFSAASFVVVWITNFLYEHLKKTTGRISASTALLIMFCIIISFFMVTVADILLREPEKREAYDENEKKQSIKKISLGERLVAVLLFIITSAVILSVLGLLFFVPV